ncbi:hypothetical protein GLE_4320 [Lysobacter enzymogenes]|uniref:Uncharacterized protein n=1 Tax=Lysobacter enzymogenes TaxID=69 RepID=A0A0S2DMR6_LYSEN|nr:hypothetical protein GLE_4320 [Lysobacter enzymogenes]
MGGPSGPMLSAPTPRKSAPGRIRWRRSRTRASTALNPRIDTTAATANEAG